MAINVADLMPMQEFKAKVDEWVRTIKNTKLQKGFDDYPAKQRCAKNNDA